MDIQWVRIKSWHALRPHDAFGPTAYCGRSLEGQLEISDELPNAKSCESCLRSVARINDDAKAAA